MALTAEALSAARNAHEEDSLGHDLAADAVAHLEELAALLSHFFRFSSPPMLRMPGVEMYSIDAAAIDRAAAFLRAVPAPIRDPSSPPLASARRTP